MVDSVSKAGLAGIQMARGRALEAADKVSKAFQPGGKGEDDLVDGALDLKQAQRDIKAGVALVKTDEEMQDSILDLLA